VIVWGWSQPTHSHPTAQSTQAQPATCVARAAAAAAAAAVLCDVLAATGPALKPGPAPPSK